MSSDRSAPDFKTSDGEASSRANRQQGPPGEALAGSPGTQNDCTHTYPRERDKFSGTDVSREPIPSAGWRSVYFEMGVMDAGHQS